MLEQDIQKEHDFSQERSQSNGSEMSRSSTGGIRALRSSIIGFDNEAVSY